MVGAGDLQSPLCLANAAQRVTNAGLDLSDSDCYKPRR